jgi:hypothetical protein
MRVKSQEWAEDTPLTAQLNTVMFSGKNRILIFLGRSHKEEQ